MKDGSIAKPYINQRGILKKDKSQDSWINFSCRPVNTAKAS